MEFCGARPAVEQGAAGERVPGEGVARAGFGGGCHWCTEAVFQALAGVVRVEQGFIAAPAPDEAFSEAVIVSFDPRRIPLSILIEAHLRTHASTSAHALRGKYRSAVYVFDAAQGRAAEDVLAALAGDFDAPIVTRVLPFADFRASDPRFQNYYANGPERPFCTAYIDPKLAALRARFKVWTVPG